LNNQTTIAASSNSPIIRAEVCRSENGEDKDTVVIKPQFGNEMNHLNKECEQLNMILEAMDASED
ncbi:hypothetical protein, partial [Lentilactobacillus hilgardii]|uniref:hypothetical protein n=1 Tax=Lentilactobacillus hilgardii TaxID=1588 RepID=UPI0039E737D5